jgi:Uma2 family endonuclease
MTVKIDDQTTYEPEAAAHCGAARRRRDRAGAADRVEALSPSTATRDTGAKLADYLRLPSVSDYLIVRTDRPTVIRHRRGDGDIIETRIVTAGTLELDPPGLSLDLDRIYA